MGIFPKKSWTPKLYWNHHLEKGYEPLIPIHAPKSKPPQKQIQSNLKGGRRSEPIVIMEVFV